MKSQLKEEYVIENIVIGQTIIAEEHIIVKLNLNINAKRFYRTKPECVLGHL